MTQLHRKRFAELTNEAKDLYAQIEPDFTTDPPQSIDDLSPDDLLAWRVKARNQLVQACGLESEHYKEFLALEKRSYRKLFEMLDSLCAVFFAAREDFEGGYLQSTRTLVQAEVFDSELEQARELLKNGYYSAAAVIAGVVLECTLRELCDRQAIAHSKLDKMNSDLAKASVYNKLVQKRNTALADIRNSAAHGKADEFAESDVADMIRDVERFVAEHLPA